MNSSALLVVDVQNSLFERETPLYRGDEILKTINTLIDSARDAQAPVIFVQHTNPLMVSGTKAWEIHPELHCKPTDLVIEKDVGNAFLGTPFLDEALKAYGVDTLYTTGLVSNNCVYDTSCGGMELGYNVYLVEDAHSSYAANAEDIVAEANEKMAKELTGVVNSRDVLFG